MKIQKIAEQWLLFRRVQLKNSSLVKYSQLMHKHILPQWGGMDIYDLKESDILDFTQKKSAVLAPKTLHDLLHLLKSLLLAAAEERPGWKVPRIRYPKLHAKEIETFPASAQARLEAYLLKITDPSRLGVVMTLYTGLRIGELCALRWEDISLDDRTLNISRTLQRLPAESGNAKTALVLTEPKTDHARRKIPIPDFLIPKLKKIQSGNPDDYLLTGTDHWLDPRTLQNRFREYQKQAKIKPLKFHALRHTFATHCVELGFEIKSLSEILGHSSVKITLEKYVHVSWKLKQQNMGLLKSFVA
jgi:integrase